MDSFNPRDGGRDVFVHISAVERAGLGYRGYYNSTEIKACDDACIAVTLPKPMTCSASFESISSSRDDVSKLNFHVR